MRDPAVEVQIEVQFWSLRLCVSSPKSWFLFLAEYLLPAEKGVIPLDRVTTSGWLQYLETVMLAELSPQGQPWSSGISSEAAWSMEQPA